MEQVPSVQGTEGRTVERVVLEEPRGAARVHRGQTEDGEGLSVGVAGPALLPLHREVEAERRQAEHERPKDHGVTPCH